MSATRTETGWRDDKLTIARVAAGDLCNRETMVYDSVGIDVIIERLLRETRNVDKRISDMKRKSATQQRHSASLYEKYKGRADEISKLRSLLKSLALESDGYRKERDELRVLVDVRNSELAVADLLRQRDRAQAVVATAKMRVLEQKIKARAESGKAMGKKELEQLAIDIRCAAQETDANLPFVKKTFEKSVEKAVTGAKAEVDAFVALKLANAGMEAFKSGAAMPELPMGEPKPEPRRSSPTLKRALEVLLDSGCKLEEVPKDGRFKFSVCGSEYIKVDGPVDAMHGEDMVRVANAATHRVTWATKSVVVFPVKG